MTTYKIIRKHFNKNIDDLIIDTGLSLDDLRRQIKLAGGNLIS